MSKFNYALIVIILIECLCFDSFTYASEIYFVARDNTPLSDIEKILSNTEVDGVTFYISWRSIEPQKGVLRWDGVDSVFALARANNKKVNVAILPGRWIPAWVYEENGVKAVNYLHANTLMGYTEKRYTVVEPWNNRMLSLFEDVIVEFSNKYNNNDTLGYVAITGPSPSNGLETNFPVYRYDDFLKFKFTPAKYINSWKRMICFFSKIFPNRNLVLALNDDIGPKPVRRVIGKEIAIKIKDYAITALGDRLNIMSLAWDPNFLENDIAIELVNTSPSISVGLQAAQIFSGNRSKIYNIDNVLSVMKKTCEKIKPKFNEFWIEDQSLLYPYIFRLACKNEDN